MDCCKSGIHRPLDTNFLKEKKENLEEVLHIHFKIIYYIYNIENIIRDRTNITMLCHAQHLPNPPTQQQFSFSFSQKKKFQKKKVCHVRKN